MSIFKRSFWIFLSEWQQTFKTSNDIVTTYLYGLVDDGFPAIHDLTYDNCFSMHSYDATYALMNLLSTWRLIHAHTNMHTEISLHATSYLFINVCFLVWFHRIRMRMTANYFKFFLQCSVTNLSRNTNGSDDKTWSRKGRIIASSFSSVATRVLTRATSIVNKM